MRQKCEYCGNWIDDTDAVCPHCNAPNEHMMASADGVPKTIEELKAFCAMHNLPLKDMRFFIGEDYKKPRAFGIYQDGSNFVVYKNKADGGRAVRYRGKDEAYAVNEIYQKMKSEISNQRNFQASKSLKKSRKNLSRSTLLVAGAIFIAAAAFTFLGSLPSRGYYHYNDNAYYYQDSSWYYYDTSYDTWYLDDDPPTTLTEHADDYYDGETYDSSWDASDFSYSDYYRERSSSRDDDDDDDDWDDDDWDWDSSDSWDSSSTDWDSDW